MSKDNVKSWDSLQYSDQGRPDVCNKDYSTRCKPVRIVAWDPAWPPQSEVPHAGTRWLYCLDEVEIHSGVPTTNVGGGTWQIETADGRFPAIRDLKPIPPKPQTASGEVVANVVVGEGCRSLTLDMAPGTYTIIKT